jgi:hypothetical protein
MSGERQIGLLWGAVALALLLLSPLATPFGAGLPPCFFRSLTGVPCPTCGGTRAALALAQGDVGAALRANPLVTVALALLVGGGLVIGALALAGRGVRRPGRVPGWVRAALVVVLAANWFWLIVDGR